jgi:hypothetical protein
MPQYLKATGDDQTEVLIVEYPDSPRYEVRVYCADVPQDHRTLIATDNISDAEAIYRQRAARL